MSEQPVKLREVAWLELCPWLLLVRCVRVSLMVRVILLGALGLIVATTGWIVITQFFGTVDDPVLDQWRATGCQWVWHSTTHFQLAAGDAPQNAPQLFSQAGRGLWQAPVAVWLHVTRPFVDLFDSRLTTLGALCLLLCGLWEVVVWALAGGAIARIAALALTRGEAPDLGKATRFAASSIVSYSAAPLMALAAAALFAGMLALVGLAMRVDTLAAMIGLGWPLVLVIGLLLTVLLVGVLVGWPLMWATISVEGTDAFDAVSRSYAYTYQRPLRLLYYLLFSAVLGALAMFAVKTFALATIGLSDWSIAWGLDDDTLQQVVHGSESSGELPLALRLARGGVRLWKSGVAALAAGFQVGFLWTAAVGIYLLLRHDVDAAELNEVFVDDDETDFGMPPLVDDETGIPEVAAEAEAAPADIETTETGPDS